MITKSLPRLTLVMLALFCTLSIRAAEPAAPVEWMEWAKWAEKLYPITDSQGHGPDIGSDEWAGAMDRRLKITDEAGHGPTVKSKEWRQAVEKKIVKPEKPKPAPNGRPKMLSSKHGVHGPWKSRSWYSSAWICSTQSMY